MAGLTTDPRQPSPALSSRRTGNRQTDPARPARVPREMTEISPDGSGGAALELEHQRALAGLAALTRALGLRRDQRAASRDYIDDYRYVVSAVEIGACPDARPATRRDDSPRGYR